MRPFLVPIEIETKAKILCVYQTMLYTSLNLSIYVMDFDPASYRLESTLLLFRKNTPVHLFLFRVRTNQPVLPLVGKIPTVGIFRLL